MKALLDTFGIKKVAGMEELANRKAELIYGALDKWPAVYRVVPEKATRSRMNICFRVLEGKDDAEARWLKEAEQNGLMGLKGHRSVGGIRCSNCESSSPQSSKTLMLSLSDNSISMEGAEKLVAFLERFAANLTDH